jgi:hypothetical protein
MSDIFSQDNSRAGFGDHFLEYLQSNRWDKMHPTPMESYRKGRALICVALPDWRPTTRRPAKSMFVCTVCGLTFAQQPGSHTRVCRPCQDEVREKRNAAKRAGVAAKKEK